METPDPSRTEAAQRILAAAKRLFGERDFSGVSTRDIADAAGVSKASVFHHYRSKAELYEAALNDGYVRFQQLLQDLAADDRELPVLLADFGRRHLDRLLEHDSTAALFLRHLLDAGADNGRALGKNIVEQGFQQLVRTFAALQQEGRLAAHADPGVVALGFVGSHLCFFLLRDVLAQSGLTTADPEIFNRRMVAQLLDSIAPPAADPSNQAKLEI
jgi:TetR/AcrR family transcriptional regulator